MGHFAEEGGPKDAAAEGQAFGLSDDAAHGLYSASRTKWNPRTLRFHTGVRALDKGVDAILISGVETEYSRPGAYIVCAYAIGPKRRILVSTARAKLIGKDDPERIRAAHGQVIEEVAALLQSVQVAEPVPVLAETPIIGSEVIPHAVMRGGFTYLVELTKGWSEGGLLGVEGLGDSDRDVNAGAPMRAVLGSNPDGSKSWVQARMASLVNWSRELEDWWVSVGRDGAERLYLGRTRKDRPYSASRSRSAIEQLARHWSSQSLAGEAFRNYGFERFRAPKGTAFQRHFTIMALRDAYAFERDLA
jgi:hypothetical protein